MKLNNFAFLENNPQSRNIFMFICHDGSKFAEILHVVINGQASKHIFKLSDA